jgi:phosphatidylglycerophosphate synthase
VTLRDRFYALIEPLARPLMGVPPNLITLIAMLAGCLAGVAFWLSARSPLYYLAGSLLLLLSGLGDCLDGIVARRTASTSTLGDFFDHVADRVVNMSVLAGLALSASATATLGLGVAILVLLNSYLGTQIEASFGRRDYSGLGKGQLFVGLIVLGGVLAVFPAASLRLAGRAVGLVDLFLVLVGLGCLQAMAHRMRLALRLARGLE